MRVDSVQSVWDELSDTKRATREDRADRCLTEGASEEVRRGVGVYNSHSWKPPYLARSLFRRAYSRPLYFCTNFSTSDSFVGLATS